ncbi:MAG: hypothetical protein LBK42_07075 [Propionibacteriaceae bacterium]|jgi:hypothetical protein|nr:hypothetical protein [Propionibacteriaceae bacterium]
MGDFQTTLAELQGLVQQTGRTGTDLSRAMAGLTAALGRLGLIDDPHARAAAAAAQSARTLLRQATAWLEQARRLSDELGRRIAA